MSSLSFISALGWEFAGTCLLILLGAGVCASNSLRTSAAKDTGWLLIAFGWGLSVYVGASVASPTGGHLNPAVTLWAAFSGNLEWNLVPAYVIGQFLGAAAGATLAWVAFKQLFDANEHAPADQAATADQSPETYRGNLDTTGIFFTAPAHPRNRWNFATEFIGTCVLLIFIAFGPTGGDLGPLTYFGVSFVVIAIGMALGTPTGYAINPARDLGPRIAYALWLPIRGKGPANFSYAWVPVLAPSLAGVAVGLLTLLVDTPS